MKPERQIIIVLGIIFNSRNQILIHQRFDPQIPDAHLKWDIPGGKNESGETLEQTLLREVKEETSLDVVIEEPFGKTVSKLWEHEEYWQHTLLHCFRCRYISGKPSSSETKVQNLRWIELSEIPKYDFLPTTKEFLLLLD
jgi:mutator protein MutT